MSAPTREEMLEWLNNEITKYDFLGITHPHLWQAPTNRDCKIYRATRRLIENRPRVTRGFVEKWAERMSFDTGSILGKVKPQIYQLEEMLKEAGVEMEEEYKEA